jgi:hypothetical protein
MTGPLLVTDFETEENHDVLTVNGKAGSAGLLHFFSCKILQQKG